MNRRVLLSVTTPSVSDAHAVQALHGWLVRSPGLDADIAQRSSVTGHMGALDVTDIVLMRAVAAANPVIAHTAWRRVRPALAAEDLAGALRAAAVAVSEVRALQAGPE
ncbi:hypothetical protein OHA72_31455 [Dactylosporangium sp. NBC_01737]|uniref:effector-associated constant component EACC1 n=1 Tax=Dactylosporangium sp. NBC_01737 TaxID=2975959 RepID=UPI002E1553A6|nr:hypothetical protein OHA72_31455 [Dactylosporangium sp. NBC_01737]